MPTLVTPVLTTSIVGVYGAAHSRFADAQAIEHFDLSSRGAAAWLPMAGTMKVDRPSL